MRPDSTQSNSLDTDCTPECSGFNLSLWRQLRVGLVSNKRRRTRTSATLSTVQYLVPIMLVSRVQSRSTGCKRRASRTRMLSASEGTWQLRNSHASVLRVSQLYPVKEFRKISSSGTMSWTPSSPHTSCIDEEQSRFRPPRLLPGVSGQVLCLRFLMGL